MLRNIYTDIHGIDKIELIKKRFERTFLILTLMNLIHLHLNK